MRKMLFFLTIVISSFIIVNCGIYSFTGGDTGTAKTIQVNFINNNAELVEPTLSQEFTVALQDFFITQTNLSLVKDNGNLVFEGEVLRYTIVPITATANQTAAQNRLTIEFNIRYFNNADEKKNFEKRFSHFFDYDADQILEGDSLTEAYSLIFERVTQDIFNASVGGW